jgi:hypothetical protein
LDRSSAEIDNARGGKIDRKLNVRELLVGRHFTIERREDTDRFAVLDERNADEGAHALTCDLTPRRRAVLR